MLSETQELIELCFILTHKLDKLNNLLEILTEKLVDKTENGENKCIRP